MSLFCNKTFGISVNIINFLLDPTKKVSFDAVLCDKVETPVKATFRRFTRFVRDHPTQT